MVVVRRERAGQDVIRIVGLDPGLRSLGLCVVEATGDGITALAARVVESQKGSKKLLRDIRVAGDDQRRYGELWRGVVEVVEQYQPCGIALEAYAPLRGRAGGNAWKTAVVFGLLHGLGLSRGIAVFTFLPGDLKREFTGKRSASKQEVGQGVARKVSGLDALLKAWPKTKHEHMTDAAGHAYLAVAEMRRLRTLMGVA